MKKMGLPCWNATERRTEKDRPSRDVLNRVHDGLGGSPPRDEIAVQRVDRRDGSTVRPAATSAWPATWPPNTRGGPTGGLTPSKRSVPQRRSRSSTRSRRSTAAWPVASSARRSPWFDERADLVHAQGVRRAGRVGRACRPRSPRSRRARRGRSRAGRRRRCGTCRRCARTTGTSTVSTPHDSASWLRTCGSGVHAISGRFECSRARRRTVSPVWVNATSAFAPIASAMPRAAMVSAPERVRGACWRLGTSKRAALGRLDDLRHRRDGEDRDTCPRSSRRTASPRRCRRAPRWRRRMPRRGSGASSRSSSRASGSPR